MWLRNIFLALLAVRNDDRHSSSSPMPGFSLIQNGRTTLAS
jgi:hypothetical protein